METKVIDIIGSGKLLVMSLIRIVLTQVAIALVLILAPVLMLTVPFYIVATHPGANLSTMATVYLFIGPFTSAFWTMMVCRFWLVFKAAHAGRLDEFQENYSVIGGLLKAIGWMIYGFVGTIIAEFILLSVFGQVNTHAEYIRFFIAAPFAIFSPALLVILVRIVRGMGKASDDDHYEALRYAKQYVIDANRHEEKQADAIWLQDLGVRA